MGTSMKFRPIRLLIGLSTLYTYVAAQEVTRISVPPVSGCQPSCVALAASRFWSWSALEVTSSIDYATVMTIIDEENGSIHITTIFNELPSGISPPAVNEAGSQTAQVTIETAKFQFTTIDLVYPTELGISDLSYNWNGVLPTEDAAGNFICSTAETRQSINFIDLTATVSTLTSQEADPTDRGGTMYTLWPNQCGGLDGNLLLNPPTFNQNDGAVRYCELLPGFCAPAALQTVQLLTVTETSYARAVATSSTTSSADPSSVSSSPNPSSPSPIEAQQTQSSSASAPVSFSVFSGASTVMIFLHAAEYLIHVPRV